MASTMKIVLNILFILLIDVLSQACAEICLDSKHTCQAPQKCCTANGGITCCIPDGYAGTYRSIRWSIWNMWYFWFILIFILMSCFGGCGYWRRRQLMLAQQQSGIHPHSYENCVHTRPRCHRNTSVTIPVYPAYESPFAPNPHLASPVPISTGPAQGIFPSPPPYSEVVSKPDVYPPTKDELPPYPGEPVVTADSSDYRNMPVQQQQHMSSIAGHATVPGLPPYSAQTDSAAASQRDATIADQQAATNDISSANSSNQHYARFNNAPA